MSLLKSAARFWYRHRFQRKRAKGFYDRGVYVRVKPEYSWHSGNFMPVGQSQVERLPEGARSDSTLTLYTDAELVTAEAPNQVADRVLFDGVEYEASSGQKWLSHNWYIVTKVGQ